MAAMSDSWDLPESPADRTVSVSVAVTFRDLQADDLSADRLGWSGGPAHLAALSSALERAWQGEVDLLVGELANGALIACGAVNHAKTPSEVWMLSVDERWQSLGIGTALIETLEQRISDRGMTQARIAVEWDNPRAKALYRRLGYRDSGVELDGWPRDDGSRWVTLSTVMTKQLPAAD